VSNKIVQRERGRERVFACVRESVCERLCNIIVSQHIQRERERERVCICLCV